MQVTIKKAKNERDKLERKKNGENHWERHILCSRNYKKKLFL